MSRHESESWLIMSRHESESWLIMSRHESESWLAHDVVHVSTYTYIYAIHTRTHTYTRTLGYSYKRMCVCIQQQYSRYAGGGFKYGVSESEGMQPACQAALFFLGSALGEYTCMHVHICVYMYMWLSLIKSYIYI
jgi:hypothetical protein